jgi:hypothetical protein
MQGGMPPNRCHVRARAVRRKLKKLPKRPTETAFYGGGNEKKEKEYSTTLPKANGPLFILLFFFVYASIRKASRLVQYLIYESI